MSLSDDPEFAAAARAYFKKLLTRRELPLQDGPTAVPINQIPSRCGDPYAVRVDVEVVDLSKLTFVQSQTLVKGAFEGPCWHATCSCAPATFLNSKDSQYYCAGCANETNRRWRSFGWSEEPVCVEAKPKVVEAEKKPLAAKNSDDADAYWDFC